MGSSHRSAATWFIAIVAVAVGLPAVLGGAFTGNGTQPPLAFSPYPPGACAGCHGSTGNCHNVTSPVLTLIDSNGINTGVPMPIERTYTETAPGSGILVNHDDTAYAVIVPAWTAGDLTIEATLRYQIASDDYIAFLRDQAVANGFPDGCIPRSTGLPGMSRGELLDDVWTRYDRAPPTAMTADAAPVAVALGDVSQHRQVHGDEGQRAPSRRPLRPKAARLDHGQAPEIIGRRSIRADRRSLSRYQTTAAGAAPVSVSVSVSDPDSVSDSDPDSVSDSDPDPDPEPDPGDSVNGAASIPATGAPPADLPSLTLCRARPGRGSRIPSTDGVPKPVRHLANQCCRPSRCAGSWCAPTAPPRRPCR